MMKTRIFFMLCLLTAFAACSKEEKAPVTKEDPVATEVQGNFSITASSDIVSRTELDGENYIIWKSGDKISVWEAGNSGNSNVQLSLDAASVGERSGKFTGSLTPAGSNFTLYAIYPYSSSYATDPTAVSVSLPVEVNQVDNANGLIGVSDFMAGSANLKSSDESYKMHFNYPLTILDIVIDGSNSCLSGATIESLTITANTAFTGAATLNLTDGSLVPEDVAAGKSLKINFPSTATMGTARHAWVNIYPVDLTAASCCFDLKMTNGQEIKFNVNPKKAFEAQKIYPINLTNIDAHVDAEEASPVFLDLVAQNYSKGYSPNRANCYLITEGGYYKFAAQKVDKSNVYEGSKPYDEGYRAKWLWATDNASKVDFISLGNSGAVNFRAPAGANGSTIIAVTDPSDNILWSWHIWCAPADILTPEHYGRNNAWLMSDANLGAKGKSGTDAYGFYYQWGRKDPFPADKNSCVFNTGVTIDYLSSTNAAVTAGAVAYATAHPTRLLLENSYRTWISNADDANNAQSLWNSTTTKANKTNYDPCPAGYCVPCQNGYAWYTVFTASAMTWQTGGVIYTDPASVATYYPAAGYLKGLTLTDAGATVRNWGGNLSATPSATANMAGYSLLITLSAQTVKVNEASRAAFGLPVRCMKI